MAFLLVVKLLEVHVCASFFGVMDVVSLDPVVWIRFSGDGCICMVFFAFLMIFGCQCCFNSKEQRYNKVHVLFHWKCINYYGFKVWFPWIIPFNLVIYSRDKKSIVDIWNFVEIFSSSWECSFHSFFLKFSKKPIGFYDLCFWDVCRRNPELLKCTPKP